MRCVCRKNVSFKIFVERHSVYCLVDEVLRFEKIMPDEEKKLAIQYFF